MHLRLRLELHLADLLAQLRVLVHHRLEPLNHRAPLGQGDCARGTGAATGRRVDDAAGRPRGGLRWVWHAKEEEQECVEPCCGIQQEKRHQHAAAFNQGIGISMLLHSGRKVHGSLRPPCLSDRKSFVY